MNNRQREAARRGLCEAAGIVGAIERAAQPAEDGGIYLQIISVGDAINNLIRTLELEDDDKEDA